ncbi:MAG: SDR family NAD(P)-dependent oxidoreductase [Mucilaginibacter polytrichastri]|nr:SDR family NAD(P)-dependent oxidoreductase [Mucilaginibacter polytrichastri]
MNNKQVWFVTGASKGLGLTLVRRLLNEGYRVAATSRNAQSLTDAVETHADNFLSLEVDLADESSVGTAIEKTIARFGGIDVVVNNAGYGIFGVLEKLADTETRANFDINVFGTLNVIRAVMPHFREKRAGRIFNISSIGGFTADFAGWGIYCATKFAVAGLTEALAAESRELGIYATVVYPGYFRTNFLSEGSLAVSGSIPGEYTAAQQSIDLHKTELDNKQQGDPEKAAGVLISLAGKSDQPVHLFLGSDALAAAETKIRTIQDSLSANREHTVSTDY